MKITMEVVRTKEVQERAIVTFNTESDSKSLFNIAKQYLEENVDEEELDWEEDEDSYTSDPRVLWAEDEYNAKKIKR